MSYFKNIFYIYLSLAFAFSVNSIAAENEVETDPFAQQIQAVIASWAGAWQSQFFATYITHYHPEFEPEDFVSRQA